MEVTKKDYLLKKYQLFCDNEEWEKSEIILLKLLEKEPTSFWILTSLSEVNYEMKKYKVALEYSERAFVLNSKSPLVLWNYACVLYALDREKKAIEYWEEIISCTPEEIGYERTTEGIKWAKSLINDSIFRIGQSYYYLDEDEKAKEYIQKHLNNRKRGQLSLYSKKFVLSFLE